MSVVINIKKWVGNLVTFDHCNDGTKIKLDNPYREKGKNAKFILPNGKKKTEYFPYDTTDEDILKAVSKKYSNFKFVLHNPLN